MPETSSDTIARIFDQVEQTADLADLAAELRSLYEKRQFSSSEITAAAARAFAEEDHSPE